MSWRDRAMRFTLSAGLDASAKPQRYSTKVACRNPKWFSSWNQSNDPACGQVFGGHGWRKAFSSNLRQVRGWSVQSVGALPMGRGRSWGRQPHAAIVHCSSGLEEVGSQQQTVGTEGKKKIVFLGTPEVAARVLDRLIAVSKEPGSLFEVAAVVTQPAAVRGRNRKPQPSPVAQLAASRDISENAILFPAKAGEESFLAALTALAPDLCITAAYGNFLTKRFLAIPRQGTVNVHPSLLPLYRGASPVQRALQDGVARTGVSVAYTVLAMDAGPIIASESVDVDPHIKAPDLLEDLFGRGTALLLRELPAILDGSAALRAEEQDHSQATHAAKVAPEEGLVSFADSALTIHNKVRAFSGWPGVKTRLEMVSDDGRDRQEVLVKLVTTAVGPSERQQGASSAEDARHVALVGEALHVVCDDGSVLKVLEIQPTDKRAMKARDFCNGLRGRRVFRL